MAETDPTQPMTLTASHLGHLAERMALRSLKDGPGGDIAISARILHWLVLTEYVVGGIVLPPLVLPRPAELPGEPEGGLPSTSDASHHSG